MSTPAPAAFVSRHASGQPTFTFDAQSSMHVQKVLRTNISRRRWLQDEVLSLASCYPAGEPVADMARRLGRSPGAVYGKARRMGLRRPPRRAPTPGLGEAVAGQVEIVWPAPALAPALDLVQPTPNNPPFLLPVEMPAPAPRKPKPFRLTPLGGRQTVWDPETVQRLIRLWVANYHHTTIARTLDLTACGVASKAVRISLPARSGVTLSKDLAAARRTDAARGPIPTSICDTEGRRLTGRTCNVSGIFFYGERGTRTSVEAKLTVHYNSMRQASL